MSLPPAPFDPHFEARSPLFWPIARAARALLGAPGMAADFPPVERFERVFADDGVSRSSEPDAPVGVLRPPVRFAVATPRPRRRARRRDPIDPRSLYDARITLDRVVPTRERSWHDLMNALVWGTFPRAKAALHARQHRAIAERIAPGARTLPPSRTRELDALALLDEGGVVLFVVPGAAEVPVVFGHAIYESLALGIPPVVVAAIDVGSVAAVDPRRAEAASGDALLAGVDEALAAVIEDGSRLCSPEELRRVELSTSTPEGGWATHRPP